MSRVKRSLRVGQAVIFDTDKGPVVIEILSCRGSDRLVAKCELGIDAPVSLRLDFLQLNVPSRHESRDRSGEGG